MECYAIVASIIKFDMYLKGRKFEVITDYQSLVWLEQADKGKISRWASLLGDYRFDVKYRKGKELVAVDYISRHPMSRKI